MTLRTRYRAAVVGMLLTALLASGTLVWQSSYAAFTQSTSSTSSTFSAGQVSLSDDDNGVVIMSPIGLVPGDFDFACVDVTYSGSVKAAITLAAKFSSDNPTSSLAPYLNLTVKRIDPSVKCAAGAATLETLTTTDETLQTFVARTTSVGVGSWKPTGPEVSRFLISYQLKDSSNIGGLSAKANLLWTSVSTNA